MLPSGLGTQSSNGNWYGPPSSAFGAGSQGQAATPLIGYTAINPVNPTPPAATGGTAGGGSGETNPNAQPSVPGENLGDAGNPSIASQWFSPNTLSVAPGNTPMYSGLTGSQYTAQAGQPYNQAASGLYNSSIPYAYQQPVADYNSPTVRAAMQAWNQQAGATLDNQNELAGFGHSNVGENAKAMGLASIMPQLLQQAQTSAETAKAAGLAQQNTAAGYQGQLGAAAPGLAQNQAQQEYTLGSQYRTDVPQASNVANQASQQQQIQTAMQMLTGPMSSFMPSTIGSTTSGK
jgi:hypothetical protein